MNSRIKIQILRVAVAGALLLALAFPAGAQQTKKVWRIGFLSAVSPTLYSHLYAAFVQGMRDLGYVEGKTSRSIPAGPTIKRTGCRRWRRSWFASRSI